MTDSQNTLLSEQLVKLTDDFTAAAVAAPTLDSEAENHHRARQTRLVASMATEYPSTTKELAQSWLEAGRRMLHAEAAVADAARALDTAEAVTLRTADDLVHESRMSRRDAKA